ncbi:TIGR02444 family protein [Vibrio sp. T187]|uniref:TIGR02444 family protein n=1 Tax=Vibrio TaxID=662 RepID=UPI0010CA1B92|nr:MULTISPECIES: TIGR02444 family protein [Vibrio]MBW3697372.1 TIGR02444 family protein [Vibrio sp. T187]
MSLEHAQISLTLERLWQFSLQYYSVREVKDACLSLQNNHNGNVNLLLLLKWLDEQQVSFHEEDWHKVQECLGRSEALLHSYRELRKRLKHHVVDSLYREALQFELQLEKQQQSDLVDCINSLPLIINHHEPLTLRYCRLLGGEDLYESFAEPASKIANQ